MERETSGVVGCGTKEPCPFDEPCKPEVTSYPRLDSARLSLDALLDAPEIEALEDL